MRVGIKTGRITTNNKGYPVICVNGSCRLIHVLVWEHQYGEKPKLHDVHHIDFDKSNYAIDNLELLTYSDHRRVHNGWVRNKNGWSKAPCSMCNELLDLSLFPPTFGGVCKRCKVVKESMRYHNDSLLATKKIVKVYVVGSNEYTKPELAGAKHGLSRETFYNRAKSKAYPDWRITTKLVDRVSSLTLMEILELGQK